MLERLGLVLWWGALALAAFGGLYGLVLVLTGGGSGIGLMSFFSVTVLAVIAARLILYVLSGY